MDYIVCDTTPSDETCAQVGSENFEEISKLEASLMMEYIMKEYKVPEGIKIRMVWNPHDFGRYPSINIYYREDLKKHEDFVIKVENEWPANWTDWQRAKLEELTAVITK